MWICNYKIVKESTNWGSPEIKAILRRYAISILILEKDEII